jgi:hypothetical protein
MFAGIQTPCMNACEETTMGQSAIEQWWSQIDPGTREWLVNNPGVRVLPRTVVNALSQATGRLDQDVNGQLVLSEEDWQFIRSRAHLAREDKPV